MKFNYGDIVYFKPIYDADYLNITVDISQVIHFDEKKNAYLVVSFDPYSPTAHDHFCRAYIKEDDLGPIRECGYKAELPDNILIFKDDAELVKNSRLIDIYEMNKVLQDYKLHKKEYPDIYEYLKIFEKK